jgi:hypothetical protein
VTYHIFSFNKNEILSFPHRWLQSGRMLREDTSANRFVRHWAGVLRADLSAVKRTSYVILRDYIGMCLFLVHARDKKQ